MSQSQQQRDVIEQKGPNQIVRIRSDSETNLDELFKAVMSPKGNQIPMSVPMRLRNLPPSFFQQPERGSKSASHSRESSADNTNYSSPPPVAPQQQQKGSNSQQSSSSPQQQYPSGLAINHPRAHSSPASLQQTYSNNTAQHQHLRQQSYDITDDIPLPPGWQMAKTDSGQRYFLNHITKTTTWEDPRKKMSAGSLSSTSSTGPASPVLNQHLGPLPEFWEQATSPEGEIYFINHKTCTTTWYDPRIPMHLQQPPMVPVTSHGGVISQQVQPLPQHPGQQSQTTTVASTIGTVTIPSQLTQQQQKRLQRLQMERERLRMRQQEILRQTTSIGNPMLNEMMMRHTLQEESTAATSPTSSISDMQTSSHTNVDPFLSGGSDFHSRQESADSGLGLGTNYSLPNTPEDYLISMDEDIASELTLESIQSSNLDLVSENMDSDDLVPSLQEELNTDLLSDVEAILNSNKDAVMKWL